MILNNAKLSKYENAFLQTQHPENTSSVALLREVGLIIGGGNHCDYLVGELRQYSGIGEDIEAFYADMTLVGDWPTDLPIEVLSLRNGRLPESSEWLEEPDYERSWVLVELTDWAIDLEDIEGELYFVYILDAFHSPGRDIRCH